MKTKPDTDQFKPKKDPSAFLEGGTADLANQTEKSQQASSESQAPTTQTIPEYIVSKRFSVSP